jgi:hypothetical protein
MRAQDRFGAAFDAAAVQQFERAAAVSGAAHVSVAITVAVASER